MAPEDAVDEDVDVESHQAEDEPLLTTNNLPAKVVPSRAYQIKVITLAVLFVIIIEFGAYLQIPPTNQIMEEIICRRYYPDHNASVGNDDICNSPKVAGDLAMIKGWLGSLDCLAPLLTSIPYGIIADKYGRRPVLSLAMLGVALEYLWMLQPLLWPNVLPLWTVWFGSVFQFIGGGPPMIQAMVWTMIADVVPVENLTSVFFKVGASALVGELIVAPVSAALLNKSPWLALTVGMAILTLGACLPPFIPETLELRQAAYQEAEQRLNPRKDDAQENRTLREQIVFAVKNDMGHVYKFIIKSRPVITLLLAFNLTVLVKYVRQELMAQYVHNRFGWSWAKATLLGSVSTGTNIVMLLAILPMLSWYITKRTDLHPLIRDMWLTRLNGVLMTLGCFMVAIAFQPWFLIFALVIYSAGFAITSIARAVLNAIVEPHTIGILNTAIAWIEMISLLVMAPMMSALMKAGNHMGGAWIGLPFMFTTALALGSTIMVFFYRLPREVLQ